MIEMDPNLDLRVIACNYKEGTKIVSTGSLAYVLMANFGGGSERVFLLVRSRGGRWIEKWESMKRLHNFRAKTVPPQSPRYKALSYGPFSYDGEILSGLQEAQKRVQGNV